eukprot:GILJ01005318.1.p1 GENE.GILJ01005318.1~~GILJ01005318.1.p1  ORF type:complete len:1434 (+),score=252.77 GILJ01005318.1:629-4303(+)
MVKDKGLACTLVIARKPLGSPVTERAIPVTIFSAEPSVKKHYLRRWLKDNSLSDSDLDIRSIIDWEYYKSRLASCIQKIVTIPAAMQKIPNTVPRVVHPDWLYKLLKEKSDRHQQIKLTSMFQPKRNEKRTMEIEPDKETSPDKVASRLNQAADAVGDMEDMFGSPVNKHATAIARRHKRAKVIEDEDQDEPMPDAPDVQVVETSGSAVVSAAAKKPVQAQHPLTAKPLAPSIDQDFDAWLAYSKSKWRTKRLERKKRFAQSERERRRGGFGNSDVGLVAPKTGLKDLAGYLRNKEAVLISNPWQVVQITETATPGQFRMWIMVAGTEQLQSVVLNVPRVFYVNAYSDDLVRIGKKVNKILPRGKPVFNLFEVVMSERSYIDSQKHLTSVLSTPDIEGVYEANVPLLFRALLDIGCVCHIKRDRRQELASAASGTLQLTLTDLESKSTSEVNYLADSASLRRIYLYHSMTGSRQVWGLFCPPTNQIFVWVVTPNERAERTNVKRVLAEISPEFVDNDKWTIVSNFMTSKELVLRGIESTLQEYKSRGKGPTILITQSPLPQSSLLSGQSGLRNASVEFPVAAIPSPEMDNKYPALDWQKYALRRMAQRFQAVDEWWSGRLMFARYAHVPVCNMEEDHSAFLCDIFYARLLRDSKHVLWLSLSEKPDLGGTEEDEYLFFADEEIVNPEITNSGAFRSVCVEIDLMLLGVNAIKEALTLSEIEGGGLGLLYEDTEKMNKNANVGNAIAAQGANGASFSRGHPGTMLNWSVLDEAVACASAFKHLRTLVNGWWEDLTATGNEYADLLIQHVYRWIRSPSSKSYDPALHRLVHKMMTKVFMHLVAEFRKLGAQVVYAGFNKIILCTSKHTLEDATAYTEYILQTVKSRPLFKWLYFSADQFWDTLIFDDRANFGGLMSGAPRVTSHWNLASYLPPAVEEIFLALIGEFVFLPWRNRNQRAAKLERGRPGPSADEETEEDKKFLHQLVSNYLSQKLFRHIPDMVKRREEEMDEPEEEEDEDDPEGQSQKEARARRVARWKFPNLPGNFLNMSSPPLEFIKSVTHVMSLDETVKEDVMLLKKNVLRLISVREFAPEAQFANPCRSFILPDVICSHCMNCEDLDLCREPRLIQGQWQCKSCEFDYDKKVIEQTLVQLVHRRSLAYQMQDLKCTKCRQVKAEKMTQYCYCSGKYVLRESEKSLRTFAQTFESIAKYHDMPWLEETVKWILRH